MPQFVAQILSLDGDVLLSNVDVSIDFSQQGMEWSRPSKNGQTGSIFLPRMWTSSPHSRSGLGPHSLAWCIAT